MGLLDNMWDDVVAGPQPDHSGFGKLRVTPTVTIPAGDMKFQRSISMPIASSPGTPTTPGTPSSARQKDNVWRSVFNPGSNLNTRTVGAHEYYDKPQPSSPTVYDWLYSDDTRSKHR
ncbi:Dormancy-associated protein homolog 2-like protein [Drosera capensis]